MTHFLSRFRAGVSRRASRLETSCVLIFWRWLGAGCAAARPWMGAAALSCGMLIVLRLSVFFAAGPSALGLDRGSGGTFLFIAHCGGVAMSFALCVFACGRLASWVCRKAPTALSTLQASSQAHVQASLARARAMEEREEISRECPLAKPCASAPRL